MNFKMQVYPNEIQDIKAVLFIYFYLFTLIVFTPTSAA